jgi:hypothetical protein
MTKATKAYFQKTAQRSRRGPTIPTPVSPATEITDAGGMAELFGVRKGTLYNLIGSVPELRDASISLAREGQQRGKRLYFTEPFRRYFAARRQS